VAALAGFVAACFGGGSYACEDAAQCDRRDGGVCEASGYCSYPDGDCDSGQAYDDLAPGELHEACVPTDASTGTTSDGADTGTTGCIPNVCEDRDGDGHGIGADCLGADCDDDNPARFDGCKYIAPPPLGDDAQAGTRDAPWGSFTHALAQLAPGDSLVLLDGEYDPTTTGLPHVDCSSGDAQSGIGPDMPISMRAENERAAYLRSDGSTYALRLDGCAWWNLTGLAGRGDDLAEGAAAVASIYGSQNVRARRLLFSHNNRWLNSTVYSISSSRDVLLEESETYSFHRHGIQVYQSEDVTLRRCYVNARGHEDLPGASADATTPYGPTNPPDGGDTGISLNGDGHRVENCIVQGRVGVAVGLGRPGPSVVVGTIALDPIEGVDTRSDNGAPVTGHLVRDVVVLRATSHAIYMRSATDIQLEGITLAAGELGGLIADEHSDLCADLPGGCGFTARHVLSLGNADSGVYASGPLSWVVRHSNAYGNATDFAGIDEPIDEAEGLVQSSINEPADEIGLALGQCAVFIPPGSSMSGRGENGADIGANVLYRWIDGEPTDEPLWDPETGAFPCGAIVAGINDQPGDSCVGVHTLLNVNSNGCSLPASYAPAEPCE